MPQTWQQHRRTTVTGDTYPLGELWDCFSCRNIPSGICSFAGQILPSMLQEATRVPSSNFSVSATSFSQNFFATVSKGNRWLPTMLLAVVVALLYLLHSCTAAEADVCYLHAFITTNKQHYV